MARGRFRTSGFGGITGVENVIRNINRELNQVKIRATKGMVVAAGIVRKDMDVTPPLIPVDSGNLRNSWFTRVRHGVDPIVEMGFEAHYALFVHEIPKKYKRPGSGNKYFQASLDRNMHEMIFTVAALARIR